MNGINLKSVKGWLLFATIVFSAAVVQAIEPGVYTSTVMKLNDLKISNFGNGVKLSTCAGFTGERCFSVKAILYPEGGLWQGIGNLEVTYGDGGDALECVYQTEFKIKVLEKSIKVDYFGPSVMPGVIFSPFRCPNLKRVKSKWFAIEDVFKQQEPCFPDPVSHHSQCH